MKRSREQSGNTTSTNVSGQPPRKAAKTEDREFKQLRVEDALAYLEQVKLKFKDRPQVYQKFLDIMKEFKAQTIDTPGVIARVSDLFKGHNMLILGFNTFLPPGFKIELEDLEPETKVTVTMDKGAATSSSTPEKPTSAAPSGTSQAPAAAAAPSAPAGSTPQKETAKGGQPKQSIDFDQAINYVTKIKIRFQDQPDTYKSFLDILHTYQKEQTTIKKVYEQVSGLFKDHPDLLDEFAQFLPVPVSQPKQKGGKKRTQGQKKAAEQPKDRKKRTSAKRADELIKRQNAHDGEANEGDGSGTAEEDNNKIYVDKKEYATKANVSKYGPSYRLLPRNFPQPVCSERTELCNDVLNDELVSVPAGSEESRDSYKKSQCDEILYQCEDDRCELDIVIEQNLSTIKFLSPIADKLKTDEKAPFQFESLRDIHRASISRIYGDKGNEILEGLRKNPSIAIPIVLKRLRQKDDEWQNARKELNKFWREIYERNHEKFNEIQAVNFKQLEKKKMNAKQIINDIGAKHEFNKESVVLLKDDNIHFDILQQVLQLSELTNEIDRVKVLWKNLILPFLNVDGKQPAQSLLANTERMQAEEESMGLTTKSDEPFTPITEQTIAKPPAKQLMYGHKPFLLLWRYYQLIYTRLFKAKDIAINEMKRKVTKGGQTAMDVVRKLENGSKPGDSEVNNSAPENIKIDIDAEDSNYKQLLKQVNQLVNGGEIARYEEETRKLLGMDSYFVHTLDKLFQSLTKQIRFVLQDETSQKLLEAYNYERKRVNRFVDKSYLLQAQNILGSHSGETLYTFKYFFLSHKMAIGIFDPPEYDPEKEKAEKRGLKYVEQYLSQVPSPTANTTVSNKKVFLKRTKLPEQKAYKNLNITNGLECKICIATHKLFYVEETEDILCRTKPTTGEATEAKKNAQQRVASQRSSRFQTWLTKRTAALPPADSNNAMITNQDISTTTIPLLPAPTATDSNNSNQMQD